MSKKRDELLQKIADIEGDIAYEADCYLVGCLEHELEKTKKELELYPE